MSLAFARKQVLAAARLAVRELHPTVTLRAFVNYASGRAIGWLCDRCVEIDPTLDGLDPADLVKLILNPPKE